MFCRTCRNSLHQAIVLKNWSTSRTGPSPHLSMICWACAWACSQQEPVHDDLSPMKAVMKITRGLL
jgi:RNase P subunit RPR2